MLGAAGNGSQPADAPHKTQTPAAGQRLDSRILRVPSSEYKTIQAAIDDAKDGDTILVAPTHEETGEVSVDRGVTITTEGGDGASRGGASVNGIFNITASNVSLNGFRLSPRAAARCGAGYVRLLAPASVVDGLRRELMEVTAEATEVGSHLADAQSAERLTADPRISSLVVGPGVGRAPETQQAVRAVVMAAHAPVVLDADGLASSEASGHP